MPTTLEMHLASGVRTPPMTPFEESPRTRRQRASVDPYAPEGGNELVLAVAEGAEPTAALVDLLALFGYRALGCSSAAHAAVAAVRCADELGAAIFDASVPAADALEVSRQISMVSRAGVLICGDMYTDGDILEATIYSGNVRAILPAGCAAEHVLMALYEAIRGCEVRSSGDA